MGYESGTNIEMPVTINRSHYTALSHIWKIQWRIKLTGYLLKIFGMFCKKDYY